MKRVGPALARVLAAGRNDFNARVATARHQYPAFDTEAFAALLAGPLDAVVAAVPSERQAAVTLAGYHLCLQLAGRASASLVAVSAAWERLAVPASALIAVQPDSVLGALSHATLRIAQAPGARQAIWLESFATLSPRCETVTQWRAVGQVLAWRAGMPTYRDGALRLAAQLPAALASAALGAEGEALQPLLDGHAADPWWQPSGRVEALRDVGAFTGFGGVFPEPPEVRADAARFVVRSGERFFALVADAYGAALLPATADEFHAARAPGRPDAAWRARLGEHGLPADELAVVAHADALAISSPFSHVICVQPLPR
ncbi:hypothetical protein KPL74_21705 [Bacillus sp. NP157]|nr:hypothetical protein KPL74_21705 [Bacillus sp. NP157]